MCDSSSLRLFPPAYARRIHTPALSILGPASFHEDTHLSSPLLQLPLDLSPCARLPKPMSPTTRVFERGKSNYIISLLKLFNNSLRWPAWSSIKNSKSFQPQRPPHRQSICHENIMPRTCRPVDEAPRAGLAGPPEWVYLYCAVFQRLYFPS